MRTKIVLVVTLVIMLGLAVLLAACSQGSSLDVKGVTGHDPDLTLLYNNVDKYPNVVIICIHGVSLTTTTRDSQAAVQHFAEFDRLCPGYTPKPVG